MKGKLNLLRVALMAIMLLCTAVPLFAYTMPVPINSGDYGVDTNTNTGGNGTYYRVWVRAYDSLKGNYVYTYWPSQTGWFSAGAARSLKPFVLGDGIVAWVSRYCTETGTNQMNERYWTYQVHARAYDPVRQTFAPYNWGLGTLSNIRYANNTGNPVLMCSGGTVAWLVDRWDSYTTYTTKFAWQSATYDQRLGQWKTFDTGTLEWIKEDVVGDNAINASIVYINGYYHVQYTIYDTTVGGWVTSSWNSYNTQLPTYYSFPTIGSDGTVSWQWNGTPHSAGYDGPNHKWMQEQAARPFAYFWGRGALDTASPTTDTPPNGSGVSWRGWFIDQSLGGAPYFDFGGGSYVSGTNSLVNFGYGKYTVNQTNGTSTATPMTIKTDYLLPTVSISSPASGSRVNVNSSTQITANASDTNGIISKVEFFVNSTSIGTATAAPYSVNWTPTSTGTASITAVATDGAGNTKTSTAVSVTVGAAPTVSITAPTANSRVDTGSTTQVTATASATGATISKVEFFVNGTTPLGTDTSSPYAASWTPTTANTYTLTARATDSAGNVTTSAGVPVIADKLPTVTITSPASGAIVPKTSQTQIQASASDLDGTVTKVEFFANGTSVGSDTTAPYSIGWTPTTSGSISLVAKATDNTGQVASSPTVTVTTGQSPTITLTSPANNTHLDTGSNVTITADASDPDGSIVSVEFIDGTTSLFVDTTAPYSTNWTATYGSHMLKAKATDNSGNVTTSNYVSLTVNTLPSVNITSPANGTSVDVGTSYAISANASDVDGTISKVQFLVNGTAIYTDTTSPYGTNWTPPALGDYTITAVAYDNRLETTTSAPVNVTTDKKPVVRITSPANNSKVVVGIPTPVVADASDADGSIYRVEFFIEDTVFIGDDSTPPYSVPLTFTGPGSCKVTAKAFDNEYNTTISDPIYVSTDALPAVNITAPTTGTRIDTGTATTITATASDSDGTVAKVEFFAGTTSLGVDTTSPYSVTWTPTTPNVYSLTAKATDAVGSVNTSTAVSITVNSLPTVSITAPAAGTRVDTGVATAVTATAADSDGTIASVQFFVGTTSLGTDTTAPYSVNWTPSVANTYSLTAKVTDSTGSSVTSAPVSVTANKLPTVSITSPTAGSRVDSDVATTITASATDSDGTITSVEFFDNFMSIGVDTTAPYSIAWRPSAEGPCTLRAQATDNKGGTAAAVPVSVTANTLPTVTITAPAAGTRVDTNSTTTVTADAYDTGAIESVEFFSNGVSYAVDTTAPYSAPWRPESAGARSLTAKATDRIGGSTTSAPVSVTVNTLPTASITSPAAGSRVDTGVAATITAAASDSDGTITSVEFFANSTSIGIDTTAPYSIPWTPTTAGTYSLTVKATDNIGGIITSAPVSITANKLPTVTITAPAAGSRVDTAAETTVTADAFDTDGSIVSVEFFSFSTSLGVDTTAPYSVPWHPELGGAGPRSLTAKAIDNMGGTTTSVAVPVTVNTLPTASITSPAAGSRVDTGVAATITAAASDSDGTITSVEFFANSTSIGIDTTAPYSIPWTPTTAGTYSLTVKATDNIGGVITSAPVSITANKLPTVTITAPAAGSRVDTGVAATITAAASDTDGTVTSVEFFVGGTSIGIDSVAPYSVNWTPALPGMYSITAKATDNSGGSTTSAPVAVAANKLPTVSITAPVDGFVFDAGSNITITANASDADGTITKIEFYKDGTLLGQADASQSYTWTNVPAGRYVLTAVATDNSNSTTTSAGVTIDSRPTIVSTTPVANNQAARAKSPITATFSEDIDPTTINNTTFTFASGTPGNLTPITGTVTYDQATKTATFTPNSPLNPITAYTATITTGVADPVGNQLAGNYSWSFTTAFRVFVNANVAPAAQHDGTSWATAYPGLTEALADAVKGQSVLVAQGTYTGNFILPDGVYIYGGFDGTSEDQYPKTYVTTLSGGGSGTVLTIPAGYTSDSCIMGFTITGGSESGIKCSSNRLHLTENVITDNASSTNGGGIWLDNCSNVEFINNVFSNNTAVNNGGGVYASGCTGSIGGSLIYGNEAATGAGMYFTGATALAIRNSTIANNTASVSTGGLFVDGAADVSNNIIAFNTNGGINGNGCSLYNNDIYNNGDNYINTAVGSKDISEDPLFVDAANSDYHLQTSPVLSPCVDAGWDYANGVLSGGDMDGDNRCQATCIDMGADETAPIGELSTPMPSPGGGYYNYAVFVDIYNKEPGVTYTYTIGGPWQTWPDYGLYLTSPCQLNIKSTKPGYKPGNYSDYYGIYPPMRCWISSPNNPATTAPVEFHIDFSEIYSGMPSYVYGLTIDEIVVTGGTKDSLTPSYGGASDYVLTVTPSGNGTVTCMVPYGAVSGYYYNYNYESNLCSVAYLSEPLAVSSTTPTADNPRTRIQTPITATFNCPIDETTLNDTTFTFASGTPGNLSRINGTVSYIPELKIATFIPNDPLYPGQTYTATITTGLKDIGGRSLQNDYVWSFTEATTVYVNANVDPYAEHDGTSWATAYSALPTALADAVVGQSVYVAQGTYTGNFTVPDGITFAGGFSGTEPDEQNPAAYTTTLSGNGSGAVLTVPAGYSYGSSISGFTVTGGTDSGIMCSSDYIEIYNNIITGNSSSASGGGICLNNASYAYVVRNTISNNTSSINGGGIYSSGSSPAFGGNLIYGNQAATGAGIYVSCSDWGTIVNNTVANNTASVSASGLYVDGPVAVSNNIIAFNSDGGIYGNGCSLYNNDVYSNGGNDYINVTPGSGDISEDPLFVDAANNDYHLQTSPVLSPCVDTGWNDADGVWSVSSDIDGESRFMANSIDMGADEVPSLGLTPTPEPSPYGGYFYNPVWVYLNNQDPEATYSYSMYYGPYQSWPSYGGVFVYSTGQLNIKAVKRGYDPSYCSPYYCIVPRPTVWCSVSGPYGVTSSSPINFRITFGASVYGLTAESINVTGGTKGSLLGSGSSYILTVTPDADGTVTCQVPAGVAYDYGYYFNSVSNTFSVTYDSTNTDLAVVSTTPSPNDPHCSLNTPITATFNKDLDPASITTSTFTVSSGYSQVSGTVTYDQATKVATFTPDNPLDESTTYTATVSGVWDTENNGMSSEYIWMFRAADAVYVDASVDPAAVHDGTSWQTAFATLQDGVADAAVGEAIYVAQGTYTGNYVLPDGVSLYGGYSNGGDRDPSVYTTTLQSGSSASIITIPAGQSYANTVDGFTIYGNYATNGGAISCSSDGGYIVNNYFMSNAASNYGGAIYINNCSPEIVANRFVDAYANLGGDIYVSGGSPLIERNLFQGSYAQSGGSIFVSAGDAVISNNFIYGSSATCGGGLCCLSGTIVNNTIVGNSASFTGGGIFTDDGTVNIYNNIVAFNTGCGIDTTGSTHGYNDVYGNTGGGYVGTTPGTGDKSVDPLFINAAARDYHLQSTSLCIDAAWDQAPGAPYYDIDLYGRPNGLGFDMGADEVY